MFISYVLELVSRVCLNGKPEIPLNKDPSPFELRIKFTQYAGLLVGRDET